MDIIDYSHDLSDTLYAAKKHSLGILNINSEYNELAPIMNKTGTKLFLTKNTRENGQNIFSIDKRMNKWININSIDELNTKKNELIASLSNDEKTAYLFGHYFEDSPKGDIFCAKLENNVWTNIKRMPSVNSKYGETQPYVYNDEVMFFTSNRPDGIGGLDLYVSEKIGNGWTKPKNLGPVINTVDNEQTPFLAWDGETLYFASDGHYGLGGYDLYRTRKLGIDWTEWSEPVNLGVKVNSVRDDCYLYVREGTDEGYLSSNRVAGQGGFDVYSVDMSKLVELKMDKPKIRIYGEISDEEGKPVMTEFEIKYIYDNEMYENVVASDEDGYYETYVDKTDIYEYKIAKEGFFVKKGNILPADEDEIEYNITLKPFKTGEKFEVENIYFEFNKYDLKPNSFPELNELVEHLKNNPGKMVEIAGHTDSIGSEKYNMELSQKRAQSVVDYLIDKGINADRIVAKGYGETRAVADNTTEEGRARNRRVVMEIKEDIE